MRRQRTGEARHDVEVRQFHVRNSFATRLLRKLSTRDPHLLVGAGRGTNHSLRVWGSLLKTCAEEGVLLLHTIAYFVSNSVRVGLGIRESGRRLFMLPLSSAHVVYIYIRI